MRLYDIVVLVTPDLADDDAAKVAGEYKKILVDGGYHLERVVPIDQFLFSAHVEAVAQLRR